MRPDLTAIVAAAENRAIGLHGHIPWHLPEDLKFFRRTTSGHAILMGRKTWQSIGRPLPNRVNIVLSRTLAAEDAPGAVVVRTLEQALAAAPSDVKLYVIGGEEVYRLAWPQTGEILLTHVEGRPEADAFFPAWEDEFEPAETLLSGDGFVTRRWARKGCTTADST